MTAKILLTPVAALLIAMWYYATFEQGFATGWIYLVIAALIIRRLYL